jgi:thioredoxin reductase/NAD-dependent dihydropyrimidine dehydrogenase PreA subunit
MTWIVIVLVPLALALILGVAWQRKLERARTALVLDERRKARTRGTDRARLQYPHIDLARCIGCGSCVQACPEDDVLGMLHGQAVVLHGARCVGHGRCAQECPTGAIVVTLGDVSQRDDIPVVDERFESPRTRGLFLAGEVTGWSLVRTAVVQGTSVVDEVARRIASEGRPVGAPPGNHALDGQPAPQHDAPVHDLIIVGAGPAGLAASLRAKEKQLLHLVLEQEELGGTVAKYPRRKLVMTQPVELPLVGPLERTSFEKEELVELWTRLAREHQLPIRTGVIVHKVEPLDAGLLRVHTSSGTWTARNVLLALGRRGTPRKLGVPGEDLAKVSYSLLDAQSYSGRRILVVGGGDSAVEAALGLAETGNEVVLSYRQAAFTRLRSRNEARILEAIAKGSVHMEWKSELKLVSPSQVILATQRGELQLDNDEVFIFAGGTPPFELLQRSGVSFDPKDRLDTVHTQDDSGLLRGLTAALILALLVLGAAVVWRSYYFATPVERVHHPLHELLRPSGSVGLWLGVAAVLLILCNLAYLLRRAGTFASGTFALVRGSLQTWMTSHVATGIGAFLLAALHAALSPGNTVGGHAFWALAFLVVTGAIGRWFYSFVPRAANGRELALEEVQARMAQLSSEWDRGSAFGAMARDAVQRMVSEGRWDGGFVARLVALRRSEGRLKLLVLQLRTAGEREGIAPDKLEALLDLARRAQRTAVVAAHYEDVRALLASWRWFHRWVALFMVLVVAVHIWTALRYGGMWR